MDAVPYANIDNYSLGLEKQGFRGVTVFRDPQNNVFLTVKSESLGRKFLLLDKDGKQVGMVNTKITIINQTYELFDSGNGLIGRIVVKQDFFSSGESLLLQDPNGNTLVIAQGSISNLNFELNSADGTKHIAIVSSPVGKEPGLLQNYKDFVMKAYNVEILDKTINDVSRLFILEFLVVMECMMDTHRSHGTGIGTMGGMGGPVFKL